jgi:hypothetical protein
VGGLNFPPGISIYYVSTKPEVPLVLELRSADFDFLYGLCVKSSFYLPLITNPYLTQTPIKAKRNRLPSHHFFLKIRMSRIEQQVT